MLLLGVVFCLARVIIWQPRICPCLCPKSARSHHRKASRNSAFFTAASAAMTTATAVSIRYGKQSLIEQNDPFIQNYRVSVRFAVDFIDFLLIFIVFRDSSIDGLMDGSEC